MNEFTDDTPMPFGDHKGKPLGRVPAQELLNWHKRYEGHNFTFPPHQRLYHYIEDHLSVLQDEVEAVRIHKLRNPQIL
jgi:uncharacterized protein (DUF3820 family)